VVRHSETAGGAGLCPHARPPARRTHGPEDRATRFLSSRLDVHILNVMYRVITREKPGVPVRAAVTAAAALALTILAAWQLTRSRNGPLPAGSELTLPGWPFTFAVPVGWKPLQGPDEEAASGRWRDEIAFRSSGVRDGAVRLLVGYHTIDPGTLPREYAASLIEHRLLREFNLQEDDLDAESASISVFKLPLGSLYGECVRWIAYPSDTDYLIAVAAASLPNGRAFSVQAWCPASMGTVAMKAVRTVCNSIRVQRPALGRDPVGSGIKCESPAGAWVVQSRDEFAASIMLTASADAEFAFQVEVRPTFLIEGRTPFDLLYDCAVNYGRELTPKIPLERESVGGRAAAHAVMPQGSMVGDLRVVDLLDGHAAIVVGHAAPDHAEQLDRLCHQVADTIAVSAHGWPYSLAGAQANGAKLISRIAREGVDWLLPDGEQSSRLVVESGGQLRGGEETQWIAPDRDDEEWSGGLRHERVVEGRVVMRVERNWTISGDGAAFTSKEQITANPAAGTAAIMTHLSRAAGDSTLDYRVEAADQTYEASFPATAEYLPDPIIYPAIRAWAMQSQDEGAVFRCVTLSDRALAAMYLRRVPSDVLPNGAATGVEELLDFIPESRIYYFDEDGDLIRIRSGHTTESRRATAQDRLRPFEKLLRDMAAGRRRIERVAP